MRLGEILFFSLIGPIILLAITSQREVYPDAGSNREHVTQDSKEEVSREQN